ncbi:MAG: hypothetical protein M3165_02705 [Actinomycetota bacterium]|nr:hypothetical protein [Actinomycetota bacterium]
MLDTGLVADLPRPVEVLHDGRWCLGVLEAVQRDDGRWRAFVRYRVAPGSTFLQWRDGAEVRRPA